MDGLVAFLQARIAADEAAAQAAYDEASDYRVVGSWLAELHFSRWKPDRVLADCAAKRAIVEFHRADGDQCGTLLALAQPYADHADFQDAWRVTFDALYPD